jgi:hypothetical protein
MYIHIRLYPYADTWTVFIHGIRPCVLSLSCRYASMRMLVHMHKHGKPIYVCNHIDLHVLRAGVTERNAMGVETNFL